MTKRLRGSPGALLLLLLLALTERPAAAVIQVDSLALGRFGHVVVYRASPRPKHVAVFLSGDGGWNLGVVDMARELTALDVMVIGVDLPHYLKGVEAEKAACAYPAADIEALSQFTQKKLGRPDYTLPVLVGYSSGATAVYALLAEAPVGTFAGGISLGFCADLKGVKPWCRGQRLSAHRSADGKSWVYEPTALACPWRVLQGAGDQCCDPRAAADFVAKTSGGKLLSLPRVGHGFGIEARWREPFRQAFRDVSVAVAPATRTMAHSASAPADVRDLPLVELPAQGPERDLLAVMVTGDGGWAGIDRELGAAFSRAGLPVVGLDAQQFFWNAKTPDQCGDALTRILRHYLAARHKSRALLVGYSRGADVLPFMARRLPADLRARVALMALLAPSNESTFEFHLLDLLGGSSGANPLPVLPEVEALSGTPILCLYGDSDSDCLCPHLKPSQATVEILPGGHHFNGDYDALGKRILKQALERR